MKLSNYIKLSKNDYNRIVLTDVLPYELPFIFTNEGFYNNIQSGEFKKSKFLSKIFLDISDRKPFEYLIKKDKSSDRKLYLVHPSCQLEFIELYKRYSHLITHLCSRSSFSLRAASSIASLYHEQKINKADEVFRDEGVEVEDSSPKYATSFFKYKKYDFLYKFYDSYEFHKIEKKFHALLKLDISKCFDSITTSMLINSLRSEDIARKAYGHHNFEKVFTNAVERANNGRTHGIVIGPEFSRIFSEIILQSIDLKIKHKLSEKNILEGSDYIIKRYVDDYFLFYNQEEIKAEALKIIKESLEEFKLYCNESKYISFKTPIITPVTSAKIHIQEQLIELFDIFEFDSQNIDEVGVDEDNQHHQITIVKTFNRHSIIANRCIRNLKCVISEADVEFSSITGYFFTLIKIKIADLENKYLTIDNEIQEERLCRFVLIVLELSFFIYAMDLRVRSTYLLSQIIIIMNKLSARLRPEKKERVIKKIHDESNSIVNFFIKNRPSYNLEILNLIIALSSLPDGNYIDESQMIGVLGLDNSSVGYFEIMAGLYCIKNNKHYAKAKRKLLSLIENKLATKNVYLSSELTHILLDSMSCPYITLKRKKKFLSISLGDHSLNGESLDEIYNASSKGFWFTDWSESKSIIERLLQKKELRTPYGN